MTARPYPGLLAAGALALLGVFAVPAPAGAEVIPEPDVVAASFAITSPAEGTLVSGAFTLGGTKDAAATVEVPSLSGGDPYCTIAPGSEAWTCDLQIPDGQWPVAAIQYLDGAEPDTATVTVRSMGAPSIDGADPLLSSGLITGRGFPGAGIAIVGSGPQDPSGPCTVVQPSGFWSCPLPVQVSGEYQVAAQHTWPGTDEPGGTSPARTVLIDKDAPTLPTVASPGAGASLPAGQLVFSGVGEPGARVEVFLNGTIVCSGPVSGSNWSCAATVGAGTWDVQAIQWDAAGNPSGATAAIRFTVRATAAQPAPPAPPAPGPSAPGPTRSPSPTPNPTPTPGGIPFLPPPVGGDSGLPPGETWDTPTDYGAAIPSAFTAPWWLGALLGLGYLVLVAVPLRLLASALRGRLPVRERASDDPPLIGPRATAALALGGAVLLAALAGGIQGEVRYLRLGIAIGVALLVLNVVGVVLAPRLAGRTFLRLAPTMLAVGAVAAILSRVGGVQPPVIVGLVIGAVAVGTVRARGGVALAELGSVTGLGAAAWLGHSLLGPVDGLWPSLLSETLAALTVAGLGSALVLLVPVGRMPGRALWAWSRPCWLAAATPPAVLAGVVFGGGAAFPVLGVTAAALVLAALCLSTFAWIRFVEPVLVGRERPVPPVR